MWTRVELKTKAKAILSKNYWKAFWISVVISISAISSNEFNYRVDNRESSSGELLRKIINQITKFDLSVVTFLKMMIVFSLLAIAFRILIGFSLEIGGRKYFVQSAQSLDNKKCVSFAFHGKNYGHIIGTMIRKNIYIFLWTLLLIIPGIVKDFAYRMVPYILADNPNIGSKEAIKLSMDMTNGHKFEMFSLDLSFIGWYILGILALGFGIFFVNPYVNATEAELYLVLRNNAIEGKYDNYEKVSFDHDINNFEQ